MEYYYVREGQRAGPVGAAELVELERTGGVGLTTLVWRQGLAQWRPYEVLLPEVRAAAGVPSGALAYADGTVLCPHCHLQVDPADLIEVGGRPVCCAQCKETYVARQTEGVPVLDPRSSGVEFAGFWIRVGAMFIDGLVMWLVSFVGLMAVGALMAATGSRAPEASILFVLMFYLVLIGGQIAYFVYFHGNPRHQATLGKKAVGIRVVCDDGRDVSYGRALARHFCHILSGMILYIGYIMAGFDDQKRALHDHICGTRVIYKR